MDDQVSIRWGANGVGTINLRSAVFNMPLANWRKLMSITSKSQELNKAAVAKMHAWFTQELNNPQSTFRKTKKDHNKLYRMYRSFIFKGDM